MLCTVAVSCCTLVLLGIPLLDPQQGVFGGGLHPTSSYEKSDYSGGSNGRAAAWGTGPLSVPSLPTATPSRMGNPLNRLESLRRMMGSILEGWILGTFRCIMTQSLASKFKRKRTHNFLFLCKLLHLHGDPLLSHVGATMSHYAGPLMTYNSSLEMQYRPIAASSNAVGDLPRSSITFSK